MKTSFGLLKRDGQKIQSHRKRLAKEKDTGSPCQLEAEVSATTRSRDDIIRSCRSDSGRRSRKSASSPAVDGGAHNNDNANNAPYIVRKPKPEMVRSKEAEKTGVDDSSGIKDSEDCNNHGCASYSPLFAPAPACDPKSQLMCCSAQPNMIKILAKLLVFLFVVVSVCYSLFRVAAGWRWRHEVLTLLMFLLATRMVCKKNWFLPSQYWRNLDPCCDKGPNKVEVTVPSRCPL